MRKNGLPHCGPQAGCRHRTTYQEREDVMERLNTENLYITSVFVLLGLMRYMQITFVEERSGSPTEILLKDRFLQLTILGLFCTFFILIYL